MSLNTLKGWDFNGAEQENGIGMYPLTMKNGRRQSAATAFLTPVLSRPNLTVQTFAQISRLMFTGNRVIGVEYLQEGKPQQSYVKEEVIVCAGTIESPKILLLSGIGPADYLRSFNLKVKANLPGVGQNLQDHLSSHLKYDAKSPTLSLTLPECAGLFTSTK